MKPFLTTLFVLGLCVNITIGQTTILIKAFDKSIYIKEDTTNKEFNYIVIHLPPKNFSEISIEINRTLKISFSGIPDKRFKGNIDLLAKDIFDGKIILKFKEKKLIAIGDRLSNYLNDLLTGKDTIIIKQIQDSDSILVNIPFVHLAKPTAEESSSTSKPSLKFCEKQIMDTLIDGLNDTSFLCGKLNLNDSCKCGIPIRNQFENIYLPPCIDKNGNALSVNNQVFYDASQKDGLRKAFLFDIDRIDTRKGFLFFKGKGKSDRYNDLCISSDFQNFEFASIKKKIRPSVDKLLAVTVIAHKDSVIVVDSNFVNYFLDSADAVQKAFSGLGAKTKTMPSPPDSNKGVVDENLKEKSIQYLKGSITLNGDLIGFNNQYKDGNFIQDLYYKELICMLLKVTQFFKISTIPINGASLIVSIEERLLENKLDSKFYAQACRILKSVMEQYDIALNRESNYRIFSQVLQVPNADEINIGIRTKNTKNYIYGHRFLIKGGWKIDFSTGVLVNGLNSEEYIPKSVRLTYRTDTTSAGVIRDTTGQAITINNNKLNYSIGFLAHIYPRSGGYVNIGAVTGVTFNNSQFMMMLGGSVMFRMGNNRLAFVGGLALGSHKKLDENQSQYLIQGSRYDNSVIYSLNSDNLNERIPRFFNETNVNTYDELKNSWFAGITYNFASFKF